MAPQVPHVDRRPIRERRADDRGAPAVRRRRLGQSRRVRSGERQTPVAFGHRPGLGRAGGRRGSPPSPEQVKAREDLRKWRIETPLDHFKAVGAKFKAAGVRVYAYNYSFNDSFTDAEIDRGFDIARAIGATIITAST